MAKVAYQQANFKNDTWDMLATMEDILVEYRGQGYTMTVRQLYYQLVARGVIPNSQKSYKRIGNIAAKGRLAGVLDWDMIEDRTRATRGFNWSNNPKLFMTMRARKFKTDWWKGQPFRVEVWVEKEALVGVVGRTCDRFNVRYFPCKGYPSLSSLYEAAERLAHYIHDGQDVVVLHAGDHDPSGMDATRAIDERLNELIEPMGRYGYGGAVTVERIALNMDQVNRYNPPPFWAKLTDSRAPGYIDEFGRDSWELDSMPPDVLDEIITEAIVGHLNQDMLEAAENEQKKTIEAMTAAINKMNL